MTETAGLRVYIVGIPGEERGMWNECEVVCAESEEHAIRLARPEVVARHPDWAARVLGDETDYEVKRYPEANALATEPKVIRDESLLRPFGWHYDGEDECQGCGEYREGVCGECDYCRDGECEACVTVADVSGKERG